ncbi:FtsX-like permease family protein [Streptomyces sp. MP131-18]|uniref:ABC transporter permease n=1 Tax=Streptomyces sp. MP131-18 TaxID=1857892 RepID=UPI00097BDA1D|nr:FtsX-like permease family protein [Streptomyces sp. MP131-18]ONK13775.1 putative ABC transporter permease YknZ [Streptomyces sp. MP131-18]
MTVLKTSLRSFFAHKWRMVLSAMAVVLSVAFVCGTLVFTATMNTTFDKLFAESASNVMIAPAEDEDSGSSFEGTGPANGVPESVPGSVVDEVAAVDGVEQATGVVLSSNVTAIDADNENLNPTEGAPTMVANWSEIELRTMELAEGQEPVGLGEVMIDADTADKNDLAIGDEIRLVTVFGDYTASITGIAEFMVTNPGAAIVYTDLPTAQEMLLGGADDFTEIYVDSTGDVTDEALKQSVAQLLGADTYKLQTADEYIEENRDEFGEVLSILEYVLLGFAGIALLVGIFLIVNTFSMLVAQRTREIGLMRAIGSSRRQVNRSVLIEALLLGVFGSIVGFGLGVGLAVGLMALMGSLGMNLSTEDLTVDWSVPVIGIVLGVIVTLLAAYIPARRAGKISPMAALRDAGTPGDIRAGRVRAALGGVLTLAGLGALAATASVDKASDGAGFLAIGVLLSLLGLILVGPALVGLVVRALSAVLLRGFGSVGRLAERNALRNPRRTGATASALMIGLALVAGLSVVGSSMVASATDEIDSSLGADYIVQTSNFTQLQPAVVEAVQGTEGLASVTPSMPVETEITLPGGGTEEIGLSASPATYVDEVQLDVAEGDIAAAFEQDGIAIDGDWAEEEGVGIGDQLPVAFDASGETATLEVRAIITPGSAFVGSWYIGTETMETYIPAEARPLPWMLFASAEDGGEEQARAALDAAMEPYPQVDVSDQAEFKEMIQDQVGQLLNMVYGLLALAIIVAILGVVNTLALAVVERTREIGLMRAIGLSRRQLRRMIRLESVVIALFGALLGLGLGMAWGAAGQQLLALEGMPVLEIPWGTIIGVFIGSAVVGLLAALVPAFRAGRMNILNAIATE